MTTSEMILTLTDIEIELSLRLRKETQEEITYLQLALHGLYATLRALHDEYQDELAREGYTI